MAVHVSGEPAHVSAPDWSSLPGTGHGISADRFQALLDGVYAPEGRLVPYLEYRDGGILLFSTMTHTGEPLFRLQFEENDAEPEEQPQIPDPERPLAGLTICLDPGHIGGEWARMEERFYYADRADWPVQEGAMNLYVARQLKSRLEALGAKAVLSKDSLEPVTSSRPEDFINEVSIDDVRVPEAWTNLPPLFRDAWRLDQARKRREKLFYRTAEIHDRAWIINRDIQPDLTLCIHFNATGYGDDRALSHDNGLAFFVHGNYLPGELADDEQKYRLMKKLLAGDHEAERELATDIAYAFAHRTGIPPAYRVEAGTGSVMYPVAANPYIYARNLAANRQIDGPVVFLEPYFMNSADVYPRLQAGDYEGEREIAGRMLPSIFREYVDAVTEGLVRWRTRVAASGVDESLDM